MSVRIAMIGTRGVPARYGGFETAVEEIGRRLVGRGHEVVVYSRGAEDPALGSFEGMELVHLPAAQKKALETLSHTALSVAHATSRGTRPDVAFVFNSANSPFLPLLRARRIPTALHMDGLEWQRTKWQGAGRRYYRLAESMGVRWADALIADARGLADYYSSEFGAETELLAYGAPIQQDPASDRLASLALTPGDYHLVVARFEPENHVLEIVRGYAASAARLPLVVVGSAPYSDDYTAQIERVAEADPRIRLLGGVWDQEQLDQLYAHARLYFHGHSVGGTNPSLLRAMGGGAPVVAWDVVFNREVLGEDGMFFSHSDELAAWIDLAESADGLPEVRGRGASLRARAARLYRWDDVAEGYESLAHRLRSGRVRNDRARGRRLRNHSTDRTRSQRSS